MSTSERSSALTDLARLGFAHLGGNRRHRREPAGQRLEIKPGAADQDRHAILRMRLGECSAYIGHIASGGKIDRGIDVAVEPVRHARFLCFGWARGQDA